MLSAVTDVGLEKITKGNLTESDLLLLNDRMKKLQDAPIFLDDTAALNIFELRAKARRLKKKHNIGLILIDYLQLMTAGDGNKQMNREQEISKISRDLKGLAKELEVPIIALSQLNRNVENRKSDNRMPQLSDLRESGAIEQDADMVMFLYRPEYYQQQGMDPESAEQNGLTEINIAKHRNGVTGIVKLKAELAYQRFEDWQEVGGGPVDFNRENFGKADAGMSASHLGGGASAELNIDEQFTSLPSKANDISFDDEPSTEEPDEDVPF